MCVGRLVGGWVCGWVVGGCGWVGVGVCVCGCSSGSKLLRVEERMAKRAFFCGGI